MSSRWTSSECASLITLRSPRVGQVSEQSLPRTISDFTTRAATTNKLLLLKTACFALKCTPPLRRREPISIQMALKICVASWRAPSTASAAHGWTATPRNSILLVDVVQYRGTRQTFCIAKEGEFHPKTQRENTKEHLAALTSGQSRKVTQVPAKRNPSSRCDSERAHLDVNWVCHRVASVHKKCTQR